MRFAIKKIIFKLDFALVFLSVLVSIFAFQSHNAHLVKKPKIMPFSKTIIDFLKQQAIETS